MQPLIEPRTTHGVVRRIMSVRHAGTSSRPCAPRSRSAVAPDGAAHIGSDGGPAHIDWKVTSSRGRGDAPAGRYWLFYAATTSARRLRIGVAVATIARSLLKRGSVLRSTSEWWGPRARLVRRDSTGRTSCSSKPYPVREDTTPSGRADDWPQLGDGRSRLASWIVVQGEVATRRNSRRRRGSPARGRSGTRAVPRCGAITSGGQPATLAASKP